MRGGAGSGQEVGSRKGGEDSWRRRGEKGERAAHTEAYVGNGSLPTSNSHPSTQEQKGSAHRRGALATTSLAFYGVSRNQRFPRRSLIAVFPYSRPLLPISVICM